MSNTKKNIDHTLGRFVKFSFSCDKLYFVLVTLSCLVNASQAVFGAYIISIVVKYLELDNYNNAIIAGIILTAIEGLLYLIKNILDKKVKIESVRLSERVKQKLTDKILSLQFAYLENPQYLEMKRAAEFALENMGAIQQFTNSVSTVVSNLITLISLSVIIATFDYVLVIILIAGAIGCFLLSMLLTKTLKKFYNDLIPINYKYSYYVETLISINGLKDFRMYPTYDVLKTRYYDYSEKLVDSFLGVQRKSAYIAILGNIVSYIVIGSVYLLVGLRTIKERLSISKFSLTVSAAVSFSSSVSSIITATFNLIQAVGYVKPLISFMNLQEEHDEGNIDIEDIEKIEFDHVTFTYPNTTKKVLDDVTFTINKNEKISIVGLNGAGKTTIVKLICKMYKPDSGEIKINGINIYEYKYYSYMKMLSSVFQDYKLFNYSILDNIKPNLDKEEGLDIINKVGLGEKINSLPNGIESNIGKDYDEEGIEMSGGQMQKVAIARSIAKEEARLLILDEPTSALDPIAEAEIYENFSKLAVNRMSIYISHRMSSSVFCDKILVLNNGKVESFAPHSELMKDEGSLYYKLFTTQAKNYQLKKELQAHE